ncbi:hypothetical protein [Micromonospora sp. NPDC047730]|uniref:CysS/YqeB C-terminal domain-containing protein n=1 Tax=Micromonospora sp. NPDC047730 TaxID=3364253 RepID=UPI00371B2BA7
MPGLPGLPVGADALLRARQKALDDDRGGEARELRGELARSGAVVRGRAQTAALAADPIGRASLAGGRDFS